MENKTNEPHPPTHPPSPLPTNHDQLQASAKDKMKKTSKKANINDTNPQYSHQVGFWKNNIVDLLGLKIF